MVGFLSLQPFRLRSLHGLWPRRSIRSKLIIAFCLFGVVPVAVVGGYGAVHSFRLLNDAAQDRLRAGVASKAEEVARFLKEVEGDVGFLSRLPTLQALINLPSGAMQEASLLVSGLGQEFLSFSQSHNSFYQIRYINELGREIVRADFDGQHHYLVPHGRLQDKRDRYYFREAMASPSGTVYASPMDLNIELGAVEVPRKPVVRYAVPVSDASERPRGIIIVNLYASQILAQILALGQKVGDVSLARSDGLYLSRSTWIRPSKDDAGSGEPPFPAWVASYSERLRPSQTVGGPAPTEWISEAFPQRLTTTILAGQPGIVAESGLGGKIVAFAPIFPRPDRQGEFWVLIHSYPKTEILSSVRSFQMLVLVLGSVVLAVALGMGVAAARHITRPITELSSGAEAIARGDFDHPIQVQTHDELEDLSHQFTRMASHLKEHERQLLEARQRAERKAQEAQVLCRIGAEILALLSLPQILQLVVDKARELLKGDLAILCLIEPGVGLLVGAVSGPRELCSLCPGEAVGAFGCRKIAFPEALCPVAHEVTLPTHIAVPLRIGTQIVGDLCVGYLAARPIDTPDLVECLTGVTNLAAIAIENARLHSEVRKLATLEERERISEDLHDGVIQLIYATGLGLKECVKLIERDPQKLVPKLEAAIKNLDTVIRDVRNYIVGLQPEALHEVGLSRSLGDLARALALNTLLRVKLEVEPGLDGALTQEQRGNLFQICREALTNVVKHAGASRVVMTLGRANGVLCLCIEDDGGGFDPVNRPTSGQGLRNMEERARRLGGSVNIIRASGSGTRIVVEFPLGRAA